MFYADINLRPFSLTGLLALDERRRLKLPDGVIIETPSCGTYARADVPESFAREFPGAYGEDWRADFWIGRELLTPDDVVMKDGGKVELAPNMTAARVMELCRAGSLTK